MDWLARVPAALQLWYGGQETGECARRRAVRRRESVGPAAADLAAPARGHARVPALPRRERPRRSTARACSWATATTTRRKLEPLLPVRPRALVHALRLHRSASRRARDLRAGESRRGRARRHEHAARARPGGRAALRARRRVAPRAARAGAARVREARARAGRDARPCAFTLDAARALATGIRRPQDWVAEPGEFELLRGASSRDDLRTRRRRSRSRSSSATAALLEHRSPSVAAVPSPGPRPRARAAAR